MGFRMVEIFLTPRDIHIQNPHKNSGWSLAGCCNVLSAATKLRRLALITVPANTVQSCNCQFDSYPVTVLMFEPQITFLNMNPPNPVKHYIGWIGMLHVWTNDIFCCTSVSRLNLKFEVRTSSASRVACSDGSCVAWDIPGTRALAHSPPRGITRRSWRPQSSRRRIWWKFNQIET